VFDISSFTHSAITYILRLFHQQNVVVKPLWSTRCNAAVCASAETAHERDHVLCTELCGLPERICWSHSQSDCCSWCSRTFCDEAPLIRSSRFWIASDTLRYVSPFSLTDCWLQTTVGVLGKMCREVLE